MPRYDLLFKSENPNECEDWLSDLDPRSLDVRPPALHRVPPR